MVEPRPIDGRIIGEIYDLQSSAYAEFADQRFAWNYLERPAYDAHISDLFHPEIRVLEIGCGTGLIARYLISRGILPQNIIGIDPSVGQLAQARLATPDVTFLEGSADQFILPAGSIDLVITNTVIHHLDNEVLERMLDLVYDVLSPSGTYFFVDVDPDHSAEGRDQQNTNHWTTVKTPWGTEVPFFNRDPYDLIDILDRKGFYKVSGGVLPVSSEGIVDPAEYVRYSNRPSRMAGRYQKVPEKVRFLRIHDVRAPSLVDTAVQMTQQEVVQQYFSAWENQSVNKLQAIFDGDAVYDEKPGRKEPLQGISAIIKYWNENPISQRNICIEYDVIGFSEDGNTIWTDFRGSFDIKDLHVEIDGVIGFTVNFLTKKITNLTEFFTTTKTPLRLKQ